MERSGQSLRSFYQYFAGKYELLLALFEESVRSTAEHLAARSSTASTSRSSGCTSSSSSTTGSASPTPKGRGGQEGARRRRIAEFAQQLLTDHPKEASQRLRARSSTLLEELLDDAAAAGALRDGLNHRRIAGVLLQAIMFNAFAVHDQRHLGARRPRRGAEELWGLVLGGIAAR